MAIAHLGEPDEAAAVAERIRAAGGDALPVRIDVTVESQVVRGFAEAHAALGGLDLVVANAGVEAPFALVDMPLEEWERVIAVNLTGAFLTCREAARLMLADGVRGAIVAISSVHEQIPWERFSHYCASKGGLKLFVQSIARELAPRGIRVVSVAPGAVATPINADVLAAPARKRQVDEQIPLGRWGTPEDVARAVAWVASEEGGYVVGSTLFVDGGMTLYPEFD